MPRLVRDASGADDAGAPSLRRALLARYRARAAKSWPPLFDGAPPLRDTRSAAIARDLAAGRPVVLYGWELQPLVPSLPSGHAYYRVARTGAVVRVTARRDPADPMSIVAWEAS